MSVYRPTYTDKKTNNKREQAVWWYSFIYAGRRIQESSKSTRKTVAVEAEKQRRRELERAYNGIDDRRQERIRTLAELADEYLEGYKLRHTAATFAEYALGHVKRLLGRSLKADFSDRTVKDYQTKRLGEKAAPKSINEETGFLLRLLTEQGDFIRAKMRREKTLKLTVRRQIARAFSPKEKAALLAEAKERRSPSIYPALMLALHTGIRDAEIRGLQWGRVDLIRGLVQVGDSKTEAGEGRIIPLNSELLAALIEHSKWYLEKFGETRPEWYVFPAGRAQPTDPSKPCTSFKTVWTKIRSDAGIQGRWHDNRHTFITDLAESGQASDETIRDLAGHVSKQMLKHYSHIRMEAKRRAVAALVVKKHGKRTVSNGVSKEPTKVRSIRSKVQAARA
jgi:integrase